MAELQPQSAWQQIFIQSVINGASYTGDLLPVTHWDFPKSTWLSRQLEKKRKREQEEGSND